MSRLEQLQQMLAENPEDTFLQYALAMEMGNAGQDEEGLRLFRGLMASEPPYVPAFFMAGQKLASLQRFDEARDVLRSGIDQARQQNDLHAAGEMSEFLASLGQFGEG